VPVNKIRRRGSYAPLSAHAYKDDRLARVGQAAELLYYRGLSFAADVIADGFISDEQLNRFVGAHMRNTKTTAARLVDSGLWTREAHGYRITAWLKWNRSVAEIEHLLEKDAGRKPGSERNPNGVQTESDRSGAPEGDGILRAEPDTDTEPETKKIGRARRATQAPTHLLVTADMREWAEKAQVRVPLDAETEKFLDFHRAKGSTFKDWHAAWRTWMRNSLKWAPSAPTNPNDDWRKYSEQ